jgi:hypothetical protein
VCVGRVQEQTKGTNCDREDIVDEVRSTHLSTLVVPTGFDGLTVSSSVRSGRRSVSQGLGVRCSAAAANE